MILICIYSIRKWLYKYMKILNVENLDVIILVNEKMKKIMV